MDVVVFVGLQGSGKSTFYRLAYAATHDLVSLDRLRNNRRPRRRQMHLIAESLRTGRSVVVDNTNPTPEDRAPLVAIAREFGAGAVAVWFDEPIGDCLARNRQREGRERVPDVALFAIRARLVAPGRAEGFDRVVRATIAATGWFATEEVEGEGS
ncbi:AAA family ATPase [Tundrisphaera sp. TA3]|uniref:AAA family ATPase n=1 Tax=Tundrisphaera sp. TA3 TaxID=3435775 RepID=UPI003EBCA937